MGGWSNVRKVGVGACALVIVSAFLPWVELQTAFGSISAAGTDTSDGDGWLTLIAAALSIIAFTKHHRGWYIAAMVLGAVATAVALYDLANIKSAIDEVDSDFAQARVGIGLWGTIAGAVGIVVLGYMSRTQIVEEPASTALPPPGSPLPPPGSTLPPPVV